MNDPSSPYVGARSYTELEHALFVGREREVELVLNKVLAERFTVLFAPSGVGKSSLLLAGVIPRLRAMSSHVDVHYFDTWNNGSQLPSIQAVVEAFGEHDGDRGEEEGDVSLLLLVLDGFEQMLARSTFEEAAELVNYLAELAHLPLHVRIVICLRAEFLARLDAFRDIFPAFMKGRFRLPAMTREQAERALIEPALERGVGWDPALVQALLDDFCGTGDLDELGEPQLQLSFVSEIARRLWLRAPSGSTRLGAELYQGRDAELNNILEDVWSGLEGAALDAAARIACKLSPPSGRKACCTFDELASEVSPNEDRVQVVLEHLQRHGLVRMRERGNVQWYELVHDSLTHFLRGWAEKHMASARERSALRRRQEARRRAQLALLSRALLGAALLAAVGWLVWDITEYHRVSSWIDGELQRLEQLDTPQKKAQCSRDTAAVLWAKYRGPAGARYVLDWLERSQAKGAAHHELRESERFRPVGDDQACDVYVSQDALALTATLDEVWRDITHRFRRVQIPMSGQPHVCVARHYEPATVGLQVADALVPAWARPPVGARGGRADVLGESGATGEATLIRPPDPELGWNSVRVKDYAKRLGEAGLDALLMRCEEQAPRMPESWKTACQLPAYSAVLLGLANVEYDGMDDYLKEELLRHLAENPAFAGRSASFREFILSRYAGQPEQPNHSCVELVLRRLSLKARELDHILPAMDVLLPHVVKACQNGPPRSGEEDRLDAFWRSLSVDPDGSTEGSCRGGVVLSDAEPSVTSDVIGEDLDPTRAAENAMGVAVRVVQSPRIHVYVGAAISQCDEQQRTCLFDETDTRLPELNSALASLQRSLHAEEGLILPPVRFMRSPKAAEREVEVLAFGACTSRPVVRKADANDDLPVWLAAQIGEVARAQRPSMVQDQDVEDSLVALEPSLRAAVLGLERDALVGLLRRVASAPEPGIRRLLSHASPLLTLMPLFATLEPNPRAWFPIVRALAAPAGSPDPQVDRAVATSLEALRRGDVAGARRRIAAHKFGLERTSAALARAYPHHVSSTMLMLAERSCSLQSTSRLNLPDRATAQLMAWAVEEVPPGADGPDQRRTLRAQLCVLNEAARRSYRFAPDTDVTWRAALRALPQLDPSDAMSGYLAAALTVLAHSEDGAHLQQLDALSARRLGELVLALRAPEKWWPVVEALGRGPVLRWRTEAMLTILEASTQFDALQRSIAWTVLEAGEDEAAAKRALNALEKQQPTGPERETHRFLAARALLRMERTEEGLALLAQLGTSNVMRVWTQDQELMTLRHRARFAEVVSRIRTVRETSEGWERCNVWLHLVQSSVALGELDPKLLRDEDCGGVDPASTLFNRSWAGLALGTAEAETDVSKFLLTRDGYTDYVRMLLAWRRSRAQPDNSRAKAVIAERWAELARGKAVDRWRERALQGDSNVWREQLIAVWAGKLNEQELLSACEDEQSFERSGLNHLGMTLSSLRAEGYFYIGLKASALGDERRARELWRRVQREGRAEYVEYALASYFLRHGQRTGKHGNELANLSPLSPVP